MNKLTKSAIAAGVGVALLLGGGGTLALWNDSANINGTNISSGEMTISDGQNGEWVGGAPALWVPGDSKVYKTEVTIDAKGDNLSAKLEIDKAALGGDADLLAALDYNLALTNIVGTGVSAVQQADGSWTITPTAGGGSITFDVEITVTFDEKTAGVVAQNQTAELSTMNLTLTQIG